MRNGRITMLRTYVNGETRNWTLRSEYRQSAIRMVLGGDPWKSATIYDGVNRVVGRLVKQRVGRHVWIDYYRGSDTVPAWSKRV